MHKSLLNFRVNPHVNSNPTVALNFIGVINAYAEENNLSISDVFIEAIIDEYGYAQLVVHSGFKSG